MGSIKDASLANILSGEQWTEVKEQIVRGETPLGCKECQQTEKNTGWSPRKYRFDPHNVANSNWTKGLTSLELNTSNICNLACTHCSSHFSSRWVEINANIGKDLRHFHEGPTTTINAPNTENLLDQLATLDLSHLESVMFKGGEPMLNRDVPGVLEYLRELGILQNLHIEFVSNGSIINRKLLDLLRECRKVRICISVDGTGDLQGYIRRGPSANDKIEQFVAAWAELERIDFTTSISVMAYNVFHLDKITEWWNSLSNKYPRKLHRISYGLTVTRPERLSVTVLQDQTRAALVEKYRSAAGADYTHVIQTLELPFAGSELHNSFVTYTQEMDRMWNSNILEVVPELATEMHLLNDDILIQRSDNGSASPEQVLQSGLALANAGNPTDALDLYNSFLDTCQVGVAEQWQIRLHRAILLANVQLWSQSLTEFQSLVVLSPGNCLRIMDSETVAASDDYAQTTMMKLIREKLPTIRLLIAGLAFTALKDPVNAQDRLELALQIDPNFELAFLACLEIQRV
jgi:pyruvate-formate lyase-activating enzyme